MTPVDNIWVNNGWIVADYAVVVIAIIAAVGCLLPMTGLPITLKRIGAWLMSSGWMLITWRFMHQLMEGVDPPITTAGQISLALLGAGTVFYIVGDRWK